MMSSLRKIHFLVGIFLLSISIGLMHTSFSIQAVQGTTISTSNSGYSSEIHSQIITSIPDFSLSPEITNQSIEQQIIPEFAPFLAITMVEVVLEQNFSKIFGTEFTVTLNGMSQTQTFTEGSMEETMQLVFIIDENSQLGFFSPLNLEWSVTTEFDPDRFWPIGGESFHGIQVQYLKIITAPRPVLPSSLEDSVPAIILPNELYSGGENSPINLVSTEAKVYVILPEGISDKNGLNLTMMTNAIVDYELIVSDSLFLQNSLPTNTTNANVELKVKKDVPNEQILSLITIRYNAQNSPPEGVIINLQGEWGISTGSSSLISSSIYDLPLFILATLIPVILLSGLFWKRTSSH